MTKKVKVEALISSGDEAVANVTKGYKKGYHG
jgi:hypothetical protein